MKACKPNLELKGRLLRGAAGLVLLAAALGFLETSALFSFVLTGAAVLALFEAVRGWCLLRACGIKTRF